MSPRPDRRPDSRPDRAPRRAGGSAGNRSGDRPVGASFRPGGTTRPRWGRPEGARPDAPGERPRYGRDGGGGRFNADRYAGDRPGPDRERPSGEWSPRERRGGESAGPPVRLDRGGPRPSLPRRGEDGRGEGRPSSDRRPSDRRPTDRRPMDRRPSDRRPGEGRFGDRRPSERPGSDWAPSDRAPSDRRPSDRRPSDRRPAPAGSGDRRPRPGAGRFGAGRPVLFRPGSRAEGRPEFGGAPRRFERDQRGDDSGVAAESDTFSSSAPSDLIWGRHSAQATLESGRPIHRIWCTPEMRFSPKFLQLLRDAKSSGVLVEEVTWARLGQISGGAVHQGIVLQPAAAETLDLATLMDGCRGLGESPLLLAVDGLTDPQNLGAIVRSAEALGAHGMVLPQRRNAGLTGSVAKVAAGALEHLPVARVVNLNRSLETLKDEGYRVIGLAEEGNVSLEEVDLEGPLVIVTGSEGDGLAMLTRRNCDQLVRIPLRGATPSLNASVATALLLYEIARRGWMRGLKGTSPAPRLVRPSLPAPAPLAEPAPDESTAAAVLAGDGVELDGQDSDGIRLAGDQGPVAEGRPSAGDDVEATGLEAGDLEAPGVPVPALAGVDVENLGGDAEPGPMPGEADVASPRDAAQAWEAVDPAGDAPAPGPVGAPTATDRPSEPTGDGAAAAATWNASPLLGGPALELPSERDPSFQSDIQL
ncbi:MAG: 23S rRNA (guanosine(2251)-2'-O)-methyltransferase RlmB [Synechococcaceae cyanobacterium ELA739]